MFCSVFVANKSLFRLQNMLRIQIKFNKPLKEGSNCNTYQEGRVFKYAQNAPVTIYCY